MTLRLLDLFAGIGGFSYAAEYLVGGFSTTQFVEIDTYCRYTLKKHWPDVPIHPDVTTYTAPTGSFDVITAGFPCQDISTAGKQAGLQGARSGLFYEVMRLVREIQPQFLILENVANLRSHADGETFQEVLCEIASAGFDAEWACIPAADLGACHKRDRIWIVAYPKSEQCNDRKPTHTTESSRPTPKLGDRCCADAAYSNYALLEGRESVQCEQSPGKWVTWKTDTRTVLSPDWRTFVSKPVFCRGDDGFSGRVDRLKALGNAVVPQVAAVPLRRVVELSSAEQHT